MNIIDVGSACLSLVHHLLRDGKHAQARDILNQHIAKYPEFELYRRKLIEIDRASLHRESNSDESSCDIGVVADSSSPPEKTPTKSNLQLAEAPLAQPATPQRQSAPSFKSEIANGLSNASAGRTLEARRLLAPLLSQHPQHCELLVALARVDMVDGRHSDALHKARVVLKIDRNSREAYRVAEQACIELKEFALANQYFLDQPPVSNPPTPRTRGRNTALPRSFVTPPPLGPGNDYQHILDAKTRFAASNPVYSQKVSIIVPVYNRAQILANTLAALVHQTYPAKLMEIVVVDDGSADDVINVIRKYEKRLNLYYARQRDDGYRLAAARNIGLRQASGEAIVFMDADILPLPTDIECYMQFMHVSSECVVIGHRRYVDVAQLSDDEILRDIASATDLPSINPNNDVADRRNAEGASIDWRYEVYSKTNCLKSDLWPFTKAAGGNIAFSRELFNKAGFVDEDFQAWGCEDGEHGYRLFNAGAYFIPALDIVSLHQEPLCLQTQPAEPGDSFRRRGHEITKRIFAKKCPAPTVRSYRDKLEFEVPKVSIYIPAFNAATFILQAIESCLDQDFKDIEICICDDGSTDGTAELIERTFQGSNRIRMVRQANGGIGRATNSAIHACRGMYIAQLDSDDLLKPDAISTCVKVLDTQDVDAVYADCDYIDASGQYIRDGWCGGDFDRDWMMTGMIATHFRMFKRRLWSRTGGCNEVIKNAVDYDLWLKFFERSRIQHIHKVLYSYRWHGNNTSIRDRKLQEQNHLRVIEDSFRRLGVSHYWQLESTGNRINPREIRVVPRVPTQPPGLDRILIVVPSCEKYSAKASAMRNTWVKDARAAGASVLFVRGDPTATATRMVNDILYVPCRDDYESLLLKLSLAYEFCYRAYDFDYVYKIDDDCYLNIGAFKETILPQFNFSQYLSGQIHPKGAALNPTWHFGKCSDPRFDQPAAFTKAEVSYAKGGYGYLLRRDVLPLIFAQNSQFIRELGNHIYSFEDVRVASILATSDILPCRIEGYNVTRAESLKATDVLAFDITDANDFFKIHEFFLSGHSD